MTTEVSKVTAPVLPAMGAAVIIQMDDDKTSPPLNEDANGIRAKPWLLKPPPLYAAFGTDASRGQAAYRET